MPVRRVQEACGQDERAAGGERRCEEQLDNFGSSRANRSDSVHIPRGVSGTRIQDFYHMCCELGCHDADGLMCDLCACYTMSSQEMVPSQDANLGRKVKRNVKRERRVELLNIAFVAAGDAPTESSNRQEHHGE